MTTSDENNPQRTTDIRSEPPPVSQAAHERIFIDHGLTEYYEHGPAVLGTFQKHNFSAELYIWHACDPCCQIGTSGIIKLQVWRFGDGETVAVFDHGWRVKPRTKAAEQVVDGLAASLATLLLPVFVDIVDSFGDSQRHEAYSFPQEPCPFCKETMASIATQFGASPFMGETLKCETCDECYLYVRHDNASAIVHLPDFQKRRGEAPDQSPFLVRAAARSLVRAMVGGEWPSAAVCADFGLRNPDQYAAMQQAVRKGLTSYELDRVLGSGKAITDLVSFTQRGEHTRTIKFSTPYDELRNETTPAAQSPVHQKRKNKLTLGF